MDIDLHELRAITNRLFDHVIETRGTTKVELEASFYWQIAPEHRYDMSQDPKDFEVGSLADDWNFVSGVLENKSEPVAYQFTELAPILEYVGEILGKKLAGKGG